MITGFTVGVIMFIYGINLLIVSLIEEKAHGLLNTALGTWVAWGIVNGLILGIIYLAVIYK